LPALQQEQRAVYPVEQSLEVEEALDEEPCWTTYSVNQPVAAQLLPYSFRRLGPGGLYVSWILLEMRPEERTDEPGVCRWIEGYDMI
jgi:hypothetical protein